MRVHKKLHDRKSQTVVNYFLETIGKLIDRVDHAFSNVFVSYFLNTIPEIHDASVQFLGFWQVAHSNCKFVRTYATFSAGLFTVEIGVKRISFLMSCSI